MENKAMIKALENFDTAMAKVVEEWYAMEAAGKKSPNDMYANKMYPFNKSLDELAENTSDWVEQLKIELMDDPAIGKLCTEYKIVSHNYNNTGGNCMVSTFQVWFPKEKRTLFVHVSDSGGTLATCDYIDGDVEFEQDMVIDDYDLDALNSDNSYFELYRYCINEFHKKDCKHCDYLAKLPYELLSDELQQQIPASYKARCDSIVGVTHEYETDGHTVYLEKCEKTPEPEEEECIQMLEYMNSIYNKLFGEDSTKEQHSEFYDIKISVSFNGKHIIFDNNAATYGGLQSMLEHIIKNQ